MSVEFLLSELGPKKYNNLIKTKTNTQAKIKYKFSKKIEEFIIVKPEQKCIVENCKYTALYLNLCKIHSGKQDIITYITTKIMNYFNKETRYIKPNFDLYLEQLNNLASKYDNFNYWFEFTSYIIELDKTSYFYQLRELMLDHKNISNNMNNITNLFKMANIYSYPIYSNQVNYNYLSNTNNILSEFQHIRYLKHHKQFISLLCDYMNKYTNKEMVPAIMSIINSFLTKKETYTHNIYTTYEILYRLNKNNKIRNLTLYLPYNIFNFSIYGEIYSNTYEKYIPFVIEEYSIKKDGIMQNNLKEIFCYVNHFFFLILDRPKMEILYNYMHDVIKSWSK